MSPLPRERLSVLTIVLANEVPRSTFKHKSSLKMVQLHSRRDLTLNIIPLHTTTSIAKFSLTEKQRALRNAIVVLVYLKNYSFYIEVRNVFCDVCVLLSIMLEDSMTWPLPEYSWSYQCNKSFQRLPSHFLCASVSSVAGCACVSQPVYRMLFQIRT